MKENNEINFRMAVLVNSKEAAQILGIEENTLAVWRCNKRYPLAYVKIGRLVKYRISDLQAFLELRTVI